MSNHESRQKIHNERYRTLAAGRVRLGQSPAHPRLPRPAAAAGGFKLGRCQLGAWTASDSAPTRSPALAGGPAAWALQGSGDSETQARMTIRPLAGPGPGLSLSARPASERPRPEPRRRPPESSHGRCDRDSPRRRRHGRRLDAGDGALAIARPGAHWQSRRRRPPVTRLGESDGPVTVTVTVTGSLSHGGTEAAVTVTALTHDHGPLAPLPARRRRRARQRRDAGHRRGASRLRITFSAGRRDRRGRAVTRDRASRRRRQPEQLARRHRRKVVD